jgi:hypothetical protein
VIDGRQPTCRASNFTLQRTANLPLPGISAAPVDLETLDLCAGRQFVAPPLQREENRCCLPLRSVTARGYESVADKGGGAHVDDTANKALHDMSVTGPAGVGVHVLFSIALGRFAQKIGLHYIQFRERFGYQGRLQDLTFDPQHPTVEACAKVPPELEKGPRKQFALTSLKRIQ